MDVEIWKDALKYDGMYQVSDLGNIRSRHSGEWKLLNPSIGTGGKLYVTLSYKGKHSKKQLHRLIAIAHVPNPYGKKCVKFKDGDPLNVAASNLEWTTRRENSHDAAKQGKYSGTKTLVYCKELGRTFRSMRNAETTLGIARNRIRNCIAAGTKCCGYTFIKIEAKRPGKPIKLFEYREATT